MSPPVVSLTNVRLSLPSRAGMVDILSGIDLAVASGEAVGIVGPSGSGKTTLLMVVAGLEKISSGKVVVLGNDLSDRNEDELAVFRRDAVGIVFQSFHLIPTMTAIENVAVPLEFSGRGDAMDVAKRHLDRVRLAATRLTIIRASCRAASSSGWRLPGRSRRARKLILADEPTGNLDQETGATIIELLFALQKGARDHASPHHP